MKADLEHKANFLNSVRSFFARKNILEVQTASLLEHTVLDPYITSIKGYFAEGEGYLQTSPEYAMKSLLALGSGDIYQIAHAFRDDPKTPWHRKEFLMLEWYRKAYVLEDLLTETKEFLLGYIPGVMNHIELAPLLENFGWPNDKVLAQKIAYELGLVSYENLHDVLEFLLQHLIEREASKHNTWLVFEKFPPEMASNAWCDNYPRRFEIYFGNVEIANGCQEETRIDVLRQRHLAFQKESLLLGKDLPLDENFLRDSGSLPLLSGIAIGLDRLYSILKQSNELHPLLWQSLL